jgi:hypothetical protein
MSQLQKVDVFSFGVLAYVTMTGLKPYADRSFKSSRGTLGLVEAVRRGERPTLPADLPDVLTVELGRMWHATPGVRPSMDAVVDTLERRDVWQALRMLPQHGYNALCQQQLDGSEKESGHEAQDAKDRKKPKEAEEEEEGVEKAEEEEEWQQGNEQHKEETQKEETEEEKQEEKQEEETANQLKQQDKEEEENEDVQKPADSEDVREAIEEEQAEGGEEERHRGAKQNQHQYQKIEELPNFDVGTAVAAATEKITMQHVHCAGLVMGPSAP